VRQFLSGSDNTGTATLTLTTGSGTAVGDFLVCIHGTDYYTLAGMTTPTGTAGTWAQQTQADGGSGFGHFKVWTRSVTAGGAQTVTVPRNQDAAQHAGLYVLTDVHATGPVDGAAGASGANSTSLVAPSVSPVGDDDLLLCAFMTAAGNFASTNLTPPSGMTEDVELDPTYSTSSYNRQTLAASGATGTRTAVAAVAHPWVAVSIAIRGAAAAAPVARPLFLPF
jgi:hypothetical protein